MILGSKYNSVYKLPSRTRKIICRCQTTDIYQQKRKVYDEFIYAPYDYLTNVELKYLVKDHKLRLKCKDTKLYLEILPEKIMSHEHTWEFIVDMLNEWKLMNIIREEIIDIPENLDAPIWIPLQMCFIRDVDNDFKYVDWIDHA